MRVDDVRRRIVARLGDPLDPTALAALGIDLEQVERARLRDEVTRLLAPRAA